MANYGLANSSQWGGQLAVGTSYSGLVSVAASTANQGATTGLRRGKIYDLLVGTNGTPADNAMEWAVHRVTDTSQVYV